MSYHSTSTSTTTNTNGSTTGVGTTLVNGSGVVNTTAAMPNMTYTADNFVAHYMYNKMTGGYVFVNSYQEHIDYERRGYVHNNPFAERDILAPDVNGKVSKKFVRHVLIELVRNSLLNAYKPIDGEQYNIFNGYPEQWAEFFLTTIESLNPTYYALDVQIRNGRERVGLFMLDPLVVGVDKEFLLNPRVNLEHGLKYYEKSILPSLGGTGSIIDADLSDDGTVTGTGLQTESGAFITSEDGTYVIAE